jgi:hypothetical protein
MVLLTANPLEDITATSQRLGVMARGRWHAQPALDSLVAELTATYQAS